MCRTWYRRLGRILQFGLLAVVLSSVGLADCVVQVVNSVSGTVGPAVLDTPTSNGPGAISFVAAPASGTPVANEGLIERVADILVYDDGTSPNCFTANQRINFTYSARAILPPVGTTPTDINNPQIAQYFDVVDSDQASPLLVLISSQLTVSLNGQASTTFSVFFTSPGTPGDLTAGAAGSAIRIRNIRVDATTLGAGAPFNVNPNVNVVVGSSTQGSRLFTTVTSVTVGNPLATGGPGTLIAAGVGPQQVSANPAPITLSTPANVRVFPGFSGAFRTPVSSGVLNDIPACGQNVAPPCNGTTSLIFDVEAVPSGVLVTFPSTISISGPTGITFKARPPTANNPNTLTCTISCQVIYDTVSSGAALSNFSITTAAIPNDGTLGGTPAIGVSVGQSAFGTATLKVLLGPAQAASLPLDDVAARPVGGTQPFTIPQYTSNATTTGPTRILVSGNWFTINSVVPVAVVSPSFVDFGTQVIGVPATGRSVLISNITNHSPLSISSIVSSPGSEFAIGFGSCLPPLTLPPGGSCSLNVVWNPTVAGVRNGTLTVTDDAPGGTQTVSLTGTALTAAPLPVLSLLTPSLTLAGSPALNLIVSGSQFVTNAVVQWNGSPRPTTFLASGVLVATISASDLATPGGAVVTVFNPPPGGGTSNSITFIIAATPAPTQPRLYYVPHVVSGGGYVTKITVNNLSLGANTVVVNFVSQSGQLLASSSFGVAGSGTLRLSTPEAQRFGPSTTQWAIIGSQLPISTNTFFEFEDGNHNVINAVGFNDAAAQTAFTVPVEFEPLHQGVNIGRTVGIAMANTSNQTANIVLTLLDSNGVVIGTKSVTLAAFNQTTFDLATAAGFQSVLPSANVVGMLVVTSDHPLAAIALGDDFGPFYGTPVVGGKPQ
jgi:hypothetical protein